MESWPMSLWMVLFFIYGRLPVHPSHNESIYIYTHCPLYICIHTKCQTGRGGLVWRVGRKGQTAMFHDRSSLSLSLHIHSERCIYDQRKNWEEFQLFFFSYRLSRGSGSQKENDGDCKQIHHLHSVLHQQDVGWFMFQFSIFLFLPRTSLIFWERAPAPKEVVQMQSTWLLIRSRRCWI